MASTRVECDVTATGTAELERRVFEFGTIETDQFHHARDSDGPLDGVDQIRRQLQIPRQRFSDVVRCAASQFQSHRRSEVALVDLGLHGRDQVGRLVFLDFEVRIARDPKWIRGDYFKSRKQSPRGRRRSLQTRRTIDLWAVEIRSVLGRAPARA